MVTPKGKQVADLALQLSELREAASKMNPSQVKLVGLVENPKKSNMATSFGKAKMAARKRRARKEAAISDSPPSEQTGPAA